MTHGARYANYIGGRRMAPASGIYLKDVNPGDTPDVIGEFPNSGPEDAARAMEAARNAFPAWAGLPASSRGEFLRRAASILEQRATEVARDLVREQGKPARYAKAEVLTAIALLRESAGLAQVPAGQVLAAQDGGALVLTQRLPIGPWAVISSWLDPIAGPLRLAAPALAFGNTVALNPSEWTPLAAWNILQCLEEAGLPAGVFNVVFGEASMAGRFLGAHAECAAVAFEGNPGMAAAMVQWCTAPFRQVHAETHGWSVLVVMEGANRARAAQDAVRGAFACAGQRPYRVSMVLVDAQILDEFLERVAEAASALPLGDAHDDHAEVGPMISREARDRMLAWIKKTQQSGGRLITGGCVPGDERFARGAYLTPAVLLLSDLRRLDLPADLLGPCVLIAPFKEMATVLETVHGMVGCTAASLYTGDLDEALSFVGELRQRWVSLNRLPGDLFPYGVLRCDAGADVVTMYTRARTLSVTAASVHPEG